MKLHQLARHQAFAAAAAAAAATSAGTNSTAAPASNPDSAPNQRRELSPLSRHQQQLRHSHQQQLSDDEDDEFAQVNFYDSLERHLQQQQQQQQQRPASNSNNQMMQQQQQPTSGGPQLDSNGFLVDKNKKLFPQKLWELIHNPSIQHCLRWSQDGQRVYLNRNEFEAYYLKTPNNQFHTQKAISFVRQMNMYGFRKVDDCYYENDNFRRDRQHLLRNMIRRHPNKGLFVGLDHHHQLAAAAAAQQALQVNQQLQQLEHQHKHRTEQALRLNSYLSGHQLHQAGAQLAQAAAQHQLQQHQHQQHHQQHHQHQHSNAAALKQMSSQLVAQAVAANQHLSQQQQHHQLHHLQQSSLDHLARGGSPQHQHQHLHLQHQHQHHEHLAHLHQQPLNHHHQPKKRLLNSFYAAAAAAGAAAAAAAHQQQQVQQASGTGAPTSAGSGGGQHQQQQGQLSHSPDSMHSTSSSVDTQPSQCSSSLVNSGSAGSPGLATSGGGAHHAHLKAAIGEGAAPAAHLGKLRQQALEALQAKLQQGALKQVAPCDAAALMQTSPTDLSATSARDTLHQTLVRSLLQLKSHGPQDLLASLQQHQQQRSLLESLASLSSVGTGSHATELASNSPTTEHASEPPSTASSPRLTGASDSPFVKLNLARHFAAATDHHIDDDVDEDNSMVLNLAKPAEAAAAPQVVEPCELERASEKNGDETELEEEGEDDEDEEPRKQEVSKKVRSYLNNQLQRVSGGARVAKQEQYSHKRKRAKLAAPNSTSSASTPSSSSTSASSAASSSSASSSSASQDLDDESANVNSITRSLIMELCDRRGDILNAEAIEEAALYTECFLGLLLEDAALIAKHSSSSAAASDEEQMSSWESSGSADCGQDKQVDEQVAEAAESERDSARNNKTNAVVDTSSICLALKLIPSKLIDVIQQQSSTTAGAAHCIKTT